MNIDNKNKDGYYVYGLIDPRNSELRYIGVSIQPMIRFVQHLKDSNLKKKTHKNNWIKEVKASQKLPELIILETFLEKDRVSNGIDAFEAEIELIAYYKYIGCDLTNGTEGGKKGYKHLSKTKTKIGEKSKTRKHSEETKKLISEKKKGIKLSKEHKIKISESNKGKMMSDEARAKISQSHIGIKHTEETKQKLREINTGKPGPMLGRKWTENQKMFSAFPKDNIPWNKGIKTGAIPWNKGKIGYLSLEELKKMSDRSSIKINAENSTRIREMYATGNYTYKELAYIFGVHKDHIGKIINRKQHKYDQ